MKAVTLPRSGKFLSWMQSKTPKSEAFTSGGIEMLTLWHVSNASTNGGSPVNPGGTPRTFRTPPTHPLTRS